MYRVWPPSLWWFIIVTPLLKWTPPVSLTSYKLTASCFLLDSAAAGHTKDNYKDGNDRLFSESVMDGVKANGSSRQRERQYKTGLLTTEDQNWQTKGLECAYLTILDNEIGSHMSVNTVEEPSRSQTRVRRLLQTLFLHWIISNHGNHTLRCFQWLLNVSILTTFCNVNVPQLWDIDHG